MRDNGVLNNNQQLKTDIEEVIKWEHQLQNIETFVATQIIKNIFNELNIEDYMKNQLITLMKKYSVRVVFEACISFKKNIICLKQIEHKCVKIVKRNKELFS